MSEPILQEIVIKASPERVYAALTDSKQFSAFTGGAPAEINGAAGGAFSCFGGKIVGRNIELVANQRVVQAWRAGNWPDGLYSIVRFELARQGADTKLVFDHVGFPPDQRPHLEGGWNMMYWEPLKKYLT
jgi:uncharacterized protein YndB with AHSA1/START domain